MSQMLGDYAKLLAREKANLKRKDSDEPLTAEEFVADALEKNDGEDRFFVWDKKPPPKKVEETKQNPEEEWSNSWQAKNKSFLDELPQRSRTPDYETQQKDCLSHLSKDSGFKKIKLMLTLPDGVEEYVLYGIDSDYRNHLIQVLKRLNATNGKLNPLDKVLYPYCDQPFLETNAVDHRQLTIKSVSHVKKLIEQVDKYTLEPAKDAEPSPSPSTPPFS